VTPIHPDLPTEQVRALSQRLAGRPRRVLHLPLFCVMNALTCSNFPPRIPEKDFQLKPGFYVRMGGQKDKLSLIIRPTTAQAVVDPGTAAGSHSMSRWRLVRHPL